MISAPNRSKCTKSTTCTGHWKGFPGGSRWKVGTEVADRFPHQLGTCEVAHRLANFDWAAHGERTAAQVGR